MLKKIGIVLTSLTLLSTQHLAADTYEGTWHLRALDGMEVRKARALLEFDMDKMHLSGFDACNRIGGKLIKNTDTNITAPMLMSTKMACRENIHRWVSKRVRTVLSEGFHIKKEKKYGIKGLTLKSPSHELFFKKMVKK